MFPMPDGSPCDHRLITRLYIACMLACGVTIFFGMASWTKHPYATNLVSVLSSSLAGVVRWYGIVVDRNYWWMFLSQVLVGIGAGLCVNTPTPVDMIVVDLSKKIMSVSRTLTRLYYSTKI